MPNWCHNTLRVSGNEEDVFRWVQQARTPADSADDDGSPLYFSAFLPQPDDIGDAWYGWRVENWGTKWEPCFEVNPVAGNPEAENHPSLRRGEGWAEYTFDTAWGPPLEWAGAVSQCFPALTFQITYGEPGMDFGGEMAIRDGGVVKREEGNAEDFLDAEMMWF